MKIAVNTRLLIRDKLEGIGLFTYHTLKKITKSHPEHKFIFIFDRKYSEEFIFSDNVTPVIVHPQARHPALWYLFFDWGVTHALGKHKPDLFLSPDGWLSLRTKVKSLPVIHDLNFFHYPEFVPWHVRRYYLYFFPRFINKASRIATVSNFTKQDILSRFDIDPNKIDVVYNGVGEELKPLNKEEQNKVRLEFSGGCPYFLFIGLIHPRKNLANLIKAFDSFKQEVNSNVKFLVVGSKKWWTSDLQMTYENAKFKDDIFFTGRVSYKNLRLITASALALVYASFFEGFGIPLLEAMYCDVPIITSRVSSMPEVGGNAALYVEPSSVESIKDAMLRMFCDTNLRDKLIIRAKKQREQYTWERTANLLWESIDKCITG
jgi:glycosyltransferase involved in cell wall biosynthesis